MKAGANLIRPISYGVIVSACITITACTDVTKKVPEGWREQIDNSVTNYLPHKPGYDKRFELEANGTSRVFKFGWGGSEDRCRL